VVYVEFLIYKMERKVSLPTLHHYLLFTMCCLFPPSLSPSFPPLSQARLRDRHQELLRKKLFFLKQQQQLTQEEEPGEGTSEDPPLFPSGHQKIDDGKEEKGEGEERAKSSKASDAAGPSEASGGGTDTLIDEDELLRGALEAYKSGSYSPRLVRHGDVDEVGVCMYVCDLRM